MMYAGSKTNLVSKLGATKVSMNALCLSCTNVKFHAVCMCI